MNKLVLVALLGFVLIALSVGEEENNESSLQAVEAEVEQIREAREAEPGRKKKKGGKRKKGGRKAAKKGKKKKSRKSRGKKKTLKKRKNKGKKKTKSKRKKSKGKKRGKGKGRKRGKGKGRKKSKGRKKKKSRKAKKGTLSSRTCADDACLTALGKYMNQYNQKYRNFENQKNRISKFSKLTGNKGGKKDAFKTIKGQIKESGGGNASALSCAGQTSGSGPQLLKEVYDKLTACSAGIKKACETDKPAINQTFIDACTTKMKTFKDEADKCLKEKDNAKTACVCWKSDAMKTASDNIGACDISKLNGEVAKFKKACTGAFAECRQTEDKGSRLIHGCSSSFQGNQLKNLNQASANKAALTTLKATIASKAARRMQTRSALSCAVFVGRCTGLIGLATNAPLMPKIAEDAAELVKSAPTAACDSAQKASLKALDTSMDTILADLDTAIADIQADLLALTGSTASPALVSAAGTTMMPATTMKSAGRLIFKNMLV